MLCELFFACLVVAHIFALGGGLFPFLFARRTIRVFSSGQRARVGAVDASAMACGGFALCAPLAVGLAALTGSYVCAIPLTVLAWFGFRLKVDYTREHIIAKRYVLYIVPWWSWRSHTPAVPRAFVDGWGDFLDPEALNLTLGDDGPSFELAWGDAHSGDECDVLADEINRAVDYVAEHRA